MTKTNDAETQPRQDNAEVIETPEPVPPVSSADHDGTEATDSEMAAEEVGGPKGPEPTRYGDWEKKGRCIDF